MEIYNFIAIKSSNHSFGTFESLRKDLKRLRQAEEKAVNRKRSALLELDRIAGHVEQTLALVAVRVVE